MLFGPFGVSVCIYLFFLTFIRSFYTPFGIQTLEFCSVMFLKQISEEMIWCQFIKSIKLCFEFHLIRKKRVEYLRKKRPSIRRRKEKLDEKKRVSTITRCFLTEKVFKYDIQNKLNDAQRFIHFKLISYNYYYKYQ